MKPNRPTSVLVIAILHLIGGGLVLIVSLCGGFGLIMQSTMMAGGGPGGAPNAAQNPSMAVQIYIQNRVASYMPVQIGQVVLDLVLSMMLIMAGIGLLGMHAWSRYLSLVYAVLSICEKLFLIAYTLFVVYPVADEFIRTQLAPAQGGAATMTGFKVAFFAMMAISSAIIIYPIVVLIIMLLPGVAAAFQPRARSREEDEDEHEEGWGGASAHDRWSERDREDRRRDERDLDEGERDRYSDRR